MSFIETYTGQKFFPLDPCPSAIRILDIAHALANQCRFSGHTKAHYSVAEHSVRVSRLVESWDEPKSVQLWALLHDASEAYLVDIPAPLKSTPAFAAYREAETALMECIRRRFDLPGECPPVVAEADRVLLATEARDLMPHRPEHWEHLRGLALDRRIVPWSAHVARARFLLLFEEVMP